ncbi:MAG: PAS domain-containing protein [Phycisphaerales bacterium]|nr:PAS domain-containing protein [Planctomycetota bacterium]MCH8507796.1 PAS domain-containing protein [Phycisphaerales bacterium]
MRAYIDRLIAGASEAGVSRWISGAVGGVAILLVFSVMTASMWTNRIASDRTNAERTRTAQGVAEIVAARTDLALRESDIGTVRRQMIDIQAARLVSACHVVLPGVGVIASSDPQKITAMELPESWSGVAATPEPTPGTVRVPFNVPGRGAGFVEIEYEHARGAFASVLARAGIVGLGAIVGVWFVFRRIRGRLAALASIGTALGEVAQGERRAGVLRVADGQGPYADAWNALIGERDEQDRTIAEHQTVVAAMEAPGESGSVVAVCDTLTHGLVVLDASGEVVYVNGAAGVLLGRHREDLAKATTDQVFQDEGVRATIKACLESEMPVRKTIEIARGEAGQDPDAELRLMIRSSETGNDRFAGVLIEDITQQRVADRSRNSFVAQATHELRTPLTNIRLYVEQAVDEGENDPKLRAQALNVINSEARRLERIVADMLSVAEIEAGSLSIRTGDVRTDALFSDLQHDYEAQAAEKTIEMVFDLPPKMPVIRADRDRLGQALHNLVGNALKYTPPGGKVTVRVEAPENSGLIIHVIDTGIGIDPEECGRIFDRFYRANDRRIAHVTGSGLGLALAREIARLHGGDITVESKMDEGSTFTITLPCPEQSSSQRAA